MTRKTILKFIKGNGITANYLCEQAGVRPSSLYRYLKEKDAYMSMKTVERLEKAMKKIEATQ